MLMPKKVKYRKQQRGKNKGIARRGAKISFGDYALQALERGWLTARQIEAARRAIVRYLRRGGKVWIRIFPDKPLTKKPAETRMGKGKGKRERPAFKIYFEVKQKSLRKYRLHYSRRLNKSNM